MNNAAGFLRSVYSAENIAKWNEEWLKDYADLEWNSSMHDVVPTIPQLLAFWGRKEALLKAKAAAALKLCDYEAYRALSDASHELWSCANELGKLLYPATGLRQATTRSSW